MPSSLTYAELFAGAGGMSLGLESAGWECVAHAEIEPHARAILRKQWPNVPLYGDVSQLHGSTFAGITMLTGGSPCQDLSIAGKRGGMVKDSGTRSSLYFEQVRIWEESGAPLMLWENVVGALSSNNGADFAAVLESIVGAVVDVPTRNGKPGWARAGRVSGPAGVASWRVLDAQFFGVPQRRRRIFVLGARAGAFGAGELQALTDSLLWNHAPSGEAGEGVAADAGHRAPQSVGFSTTGSVGYVHSDVMPTLPHLTGLNCPGAQMLGILPAPDAGHRVALAFQNTGQGWWNEDGVAQTLRTPKGGDSAKANLILPAPDAGPLTYDARGNGSGEVVNTPAGDHQNRVTDYTAIVRRNREDGTTNDQVVFTKTQYGAYEDRPNVASTIGARDHASLNVDIALGGVGIPRRLMPVECERLQGWPDQWTAIGIDERGREYALKDTPRYKAIGNGIASPVVQWIGWRLKIGIDNRQPALYSSLTP